MARTLTAMFDGQELTIEQIVNALARLRNHYCERQAKAELAGVDAKANWLVRELDYHSPMNAHAQA